MGKLVFLMLVIMSNVATYIVTEKYVAHNSSNDLARLKLNLSEAEIDLFNIRQCVKRNGVLRFENGKYKACEIEKTKRRY